MVFMYIPSAGVSQNENLFDFAHAYAYADHLLTIRNYRQAASEFERVLFLRPDDIGVRQKLLSAYLRSEQYDAGLQRLGQLYPRPAPLPGSLAFTYGKLLLMKPDVAELHAFLDRAGSSLYPADRSFLSLGGALLSQEWKKALEVFDANKEPFPPIQDFASPVEKIRAFKRKKPLAAMAMSVALPGAGRIYTKQWKDGLISFLLIGGLSYASYRNFTHPSGSQTLGWIYGGLAAGFYGGNLYGSFQSAHRYNELRTHEITADTYRIIRKHL